MDYREQPPPDYQYYQYQSGYRPGMPPVLKALIIINIVVFMVQFLVARVSPRGDVWLTKWFGLFYPLAVKRGCLWQFVTYAFMHDPSSIFHILINMLFLWMFGRELAPALGRRRFLVFYLTAAIFSGVLYVLFDVGQALVVPQYAGMPCIGASGAVMAVTMAYARYWPNRTILFMFIFPMRIRTFVFIVAIVEMFGVLNLRHSGIAHIAHLGGLLWGLLFVRYNLAAEQVLTRFIHSSGPSGPSADEERRLDEILDKVHSFGIQSLTWTEKRFLKKMSRRQS